MIRKVLSILRKIVLVGLMLGAVALATFAQSERNGSYVVSFRMGGCMHHLEFAFEFWDLWIYHDVGSRSDRTCVGGWILFPALAVYPMVALVGGLFRHRRRRQKGLCPQCLYNLTGNVSGVCPECGTPKGH